MHLLRPIFNCTILINALNSVTLAQGGIPFPWISIEGEFRGHYRHQRQHGRHRDQTAEKDVQTSSRTGMISPLTIPMIATKHVLGTWLPPMPVAVRTTVSTQQVTETLTTSVLISPTSLVTPIPTPLSLPTSTTQTPMPSTSTSTSTWLTSLLHLPSPIPNLAASDTDLCYTQTPCAALSLHLTICLAEQLPWSDPYSPTQNAAFQACFCQTSDTEPFSTLGAVYTNTTICSACNPTTSPQLLDEVHSFCTAQEPNGYLFLHSLLPLVPSDTIDSAPTVAAGATTLPPFLLLTQVVSVLSAAFTTTPPLANIPFAASATRSSGKWGEMAGMSPVMTTFTTQGRMVTEVGSWVHVQSATAAGMMTRTGTRGEGVTGTSEIGAVETGAGEGELLVPKLCMGKWPCWESSASHCRIAWEWWVVVVGVLVSLAAVLGL